MIDVNKLKVGVTFVDDKTPWKVMKYDFIKMGRGGATIKVKARNLLTGSIITKSFQSGNTVEEITLEKKHLQYLYRDEDKAYFMDPITFDQIEIPLSTLGDDVNYQVEGEKSWVLFWPSSAEASDGQGGDRILGVEVPASVVMEVTEAEHWEKGDSVSNLTKPVKVASGLQVMAPLFIRKGDKIKINTEYGTYIGRVNE